MRGQSIPLAGSVLARPSGTFTAVSPALPGTRPGLKRRPSLGPSPRRRRPWLSFDGRTWRSRCAGLAHARLAGEALRVAPPQA